MSTTYVTITSEDKKTIVTLDASLSENLNCPSEVTEFPTEEGSVFSDYIINKPRQLTIEGVITDIWTRNDDTYGIMKTAVDELNRLSEVSGINHKSTLDTKSKVGYKKLQALRDKRAPVTIQTGLDSFKNFAIKDITFPRDSGTKYKLKFMIDFQEIIIAQTDEVNGNFVKEGIAGTANPKKEGDAVGTEVQKKTMLRNFTEGTAALFGKFF